MPSAIVGLGIASIASSVLASRSASKAASQASNAQTASSQAAIAEQQYEFDKVNELLQPFVSGGTGAFTSQLDLLGVNGNDAQQAAINSLQNGAAYQSQLATGENRILQNASATGGLYSGGISPVCTTVAGPANSRAVQ